MEEAQAADDIAALTESVHMCTAEAEGIAQQIRKTLNQVMEFWSIYGEIYYTYENQGTEE